MKNGFTLVEMSIVMIIIGLLIGGVLKGQELIKNARIDSVITKVKETQTAYYSFWDSYHGVPGDMIDATAMIKNCSAATLCVNGSGDRLLSVPQEAWMDIPADINSENVQFWKHLALAGLIGDVRGEATTVAWGETHPSTSLGPGFHARSSKFYGGLGSMDGIVLVLRNNIQGTWQCGGGSVLTGACAISPADGERIDAKMDDGDATDGAVQAISANWNSGCGIHGGNNNGPKGYNLQNTQTGCDMMFKISKRE